MKMMTTVAIRTWREPAILDELVDMCRKSATTDVAVMIMCQPEDLPLMAKIEAAAEQFRRIKARLSDISVRAGILIQSSIDHGERFQSISPVTFQRIVGFDGTECRSCFCPLDAGFLDYMREMVTVLCKAGPEFLLVDDDVRLDGHSPANWACACPLHVEAFNKYAGLHYFRDQIFAAMKQDNATGVSVRKAWQESGEESLVSLSKVIRSAIDRVDPSIRCGKCVPGGRDMMHMEKIVRALAGKNKPFMRPCGAIYMHPGYGHFVESMMFIAMQKSALSEGIELLCEGDSCFHTRYHTPVKNLRGFIAGSLLVAGIDTPYTWIPGILEWIPSDVDAFSRVLKDSLPFFTEVQKIGKEVRWLGPATISTDARRITKPWDPAGPEACFPSRWGMGVCGVLGIPFAVNDSRSPVRMMAGDDAYDLSPADVEKVFSGGVLLDGAAALVLFKKGYGDLMGVKVAEGDDTLRCDFEKFGVDRELNGSAAEKCMFAMRSQADLLKRLIPLNDGVRIASSFVASPGYNSMVHRPVAPALTVFQNKLGGRVAVYAHVLVPSMAAMAFASDIRKEQLVQVLSWLGSKALPAVAHTGVDTYLLYGRDEARNENVAAVFNLNADDIESLEIQFDFGCPSEVSRLADDGSWVPVRFVCSGPRTRLELCVPTMKPMVLRIGV